MELNNLLIGKKIVMMPTLVIDNILKRDVVVPTKHEFIYGKSIPVEFEEIVKYLPQYKVVQMPKLITI